MQGTSLDVPLQAGPTTVCMLGTSHSSSAPACHCLTPIIGLHCVVHAWKDSEQLLENTDSQDLHSRMWAQIKPSLLPLVYTTSLRKSYSLWVDTSENGMKLHTRIQLGEQNMTWIARPVPLCGHEPSVPVSCDATDKDKAAGERYKGNSLVDQTVCSCELRRAILFL